MPKLTICGAASFKNRRPFKDIALDDKYAVRIQALPAAMFVGADGEQKDFGTAAMLVKSLVDENGQRLFADGQEAEALECIDAPALQKIMSGINELNGFTPKAAGDAEKN